MHAGRSIIPRISILFSEGVTMSFGEEEPREYTPFEPIPFMETFQVVRIRVGRELRPIVAFRA